MNKIYCLKYCHITKSLIAVSELVRRGTCKSHRRLSRRISLNISEIAIRKKLEAEEISFNQILIDTRMQKAVRFILDHNYHISKVSEQTGMSSVSYFIKIFSNYYGVTPKKFYLYYKNQKSSKHKK
ncbi:helix-turn-helix domain-containing protein [Escherichia coli]|nr:helix-turn-helix domain-containing protein [Escherichia coli]EFA5180679.1 AraC family transcriptional regulator [Escherichia coli]EFB5266073.1 AraC family transcriptional regulator [Escherichia coli]EFE7354888.1 AraC family transcriptional regulator [Escherichia coli]EFF0591179.1 AraC family transcriptional regulator [Escherichia coli]EFF0756757.1 AraC family transcriptional regulator [Escherichia coli]